MNTGFDASVIISTYNSPRWLELVLHGYFIQKFRGKFEILIADDGSTAETASVLERLAAISPWPIRHIWQQDDGFQKCRILNKAIAFSQGNILLFSDGDCIPRSDMVEIHARRSRPGSFLTGGYCKLPELISNKVEVTDIYSGRCFSPAWLIKQGMVPTLKFLKLLVPAPFDRIANRLTPTKRTWNGHNASCYRQDELSVNGFNEQMQYGGEDVEFGLRLNHFGITGRHLRFTTVPLHLFHKHGYVTPGMIEANRTLYEQTVKSKLICAPVGLSQWI